MSGSLSLPSNIGPVSPIPGIRNVASEGLESALLAGEVAGSRVTTASGGLDALAAPSAGCLAAPSWPVRSLGLVIAADNDPNGAGARAAQALERRASAAGLSMAFLRPPKGASDWNEHQLREAQR
jgi:putative DNA primase/helicase